MALNSTRDEAAYGHGGSVRLLMGFVFCLLILIAMTGNVLVCVAVYINKKLRKKENLYFVSLAFADLLLSILVMPFGAANEIVGQWHFGNYCKYWMCLDICFVTASILHLAAISFDRYAHINDPLRYEQRMTVSKIVMAIFGCWATSIAVAFLPLAFDTYFHRALVPEVYVTFSNDSTIEGQVIRYQCEFNLDPLYAVVSSMTSFYIPCVLMISAYVKLYRYARRHSMAIRKQQEEVRMPLLIKSVGNPPLVGEIAKNGTQGSREKAAGKPHRMDGDHKARVTLGVITGLFLASWLPFFVANIVRSWCSDDMSWTFFCPPDWLFITLTWMGYANSAQNPIIYSIFNRDFRQAFRKILFCGRRQNVRMFDIPDKKMDEYRKSRNGSSLITDRRKSELPMSKNSDSAQNRRRSASITAKLTTGDRILHDINGYRPMLEAEINSAIDASSYLASNSSLSMSVSKLNHSSNADCAKEMVWVPREETL